MLRFLMSAAGQVGGSTLRGFVREPEESLAHASGYLGSSRLVAERLGRGNRDRDCCFSRMAIGLLAACSLLATIGCGGGSQDAPSVAQSTTTTGGADAELDPPAPLKIEARSVLGPRGSSGANESSGAGRQSNSTSGEGEGTGDDPDVTAAPARTLGDLLAQQEGPFVGRRMEIDEDRVRANGIVHVSGEHLDLYSDVRDEAVLNELVTVFDAAVPFWCERFEVDPATVKDWRINGFLMQDINRMRSAGLAPDDLPPFPNGYFRAHEFWFYEQASDYYRRYLMLHEGTHAFMFHQLGNAGPPWYMEGIAERIACHAWDGSELRMDVPILSADEAPLWGRVRIIQDEFAGRTMYMPLTLFAMPNEEFLKNESYGWAWAMCEFFGRHPRFREAFAELKNNVADRSPTFAQGLIDAVGDDWALLQEDWQLFIAEMEYGYDLEHLAIVRNDAQPLVGSEASFEFAADRGWQSTGIQLAPGTYSFSADGRWLMKTGDEQWPSEPEGITIDYYRGEPIGKVMLGFRGAIDLTDTITSLTQPVPLGRSANLRIDEPVELFVRVNESPNAVSDNQGSGTLTVKRFP